VGGAVLGVSYKNYWVLNIFSNWCYAKQNKDRHSHTMGCVFSAYGVDRMEIREDTNLWECSL